MDGDRVALITGAGRGIGAATAQRLAALGWRLVLVDRAADEPALGYPLATKDQLLAVAAATGGEPVVADVRDQAALDAAVAAAVDRYGRLDAAVAAAGCISGGPVAWQTTDAAWDVNVGINLEGVHRLARAVVPALLASTGRFVAISSAAGTRGLPQLAAYSAAKHGVIGYVRSLAAELLAHGVTANAIAPGSTRTVMLDASAEVYELADPEDFVVHHPMGRLLAPDEVAATAAWLCTDAPRGLTGAVVPVDAGMGLR